MAGVTAGAKKRARARVGCKIKDLRRVRKGDQRRKSRRKPVRKVSTTDYTDGICRHSILKRNIVGPNMFVEVLAVKRGKDGDGAETDGQRSDRG